MSKSKDFYNIDIKNLTESAIDEINADPFENVDEYCIRIEKEEKVYWELYRLYKILKTMDWSFYESMDEFEY